MNTSKNAIGVDFGSLAMEEATVRIYGGTFSFVYLGTGSSQKICNLIVGNGTNEPKINLLCLNNSNQANQNYATINSGTISNLSFSYPGTAYNNNASMSVTVKGGIITHIRDFESAYCDYDHLLNSTRTLIFDGWNGEFTYAHKNIGPAADKPGIYANGLDHIQLINGASVKILGSPIYVKAHSEGIVFVDKTSSLKPGSLGFVGISNDFTSGETTVALSAIEKGLPMLWDGSSWFSTYGTPLGSSIRLISPFGIRFGFEADIANLESMTNTTVVKKGVLIIPGHILDHRQLSITTDRVLNIVATLPLSPSQPNVFTGCLIDSTESSTTAWLSTWKDVELYTRAYFMLSNGVTLYSSVIHNSIQGVWNTLDATDQLDSKDSWSSFIPLEIKNQVDSFPVTTRTYYPNESEFLSRMETIKTQLGGMLNTSYAIKSELQSVLGMALDLGIYADYYNHTYYEDASANTYGAAPAAGAPVGGGAGYTYAYTGTVIGTATDDKTLKDYLDSAKSGDVILVSGEVVIDLADYIVSSDDRDFDGTKVPYHFVIPAGVTLLGTRGYNGKSGAILKCSSYVDGMITLEAGARLSGLVLQGAEKPGNENGHVYNHSVGIKIIGDGVVIDNCEISGFYNTGIMIENASNVIIQNNYIHHIAGKSSGVAIDSYNADLYICGNLFANVTRILHMRGQNANIVYTSNVEVSNESTTLFVLGASATYDSTYYFSRHSVANLTLTHNTFLSPANPFYFQGIPSQSFTVTNNLFAYKESDYLVSRFIPMMTGATVFNSRYLLRNNVFDILNPQVVSKLATGSPSPVSPSVTMYSVIADIDIEPYSPVAKKAYEPNYGAEKGLTVLSGSFYRDNDDTGYALLRSTIDQVSSYTVSSIKTNVQSVIDAVGAYSNYTTYLYKDQISIEVDGEIYGAYSPDGNPLGGGAGYHDIYTTGDYIVTTADELYAAAAVATSGQVIFVPDDVIIELGNAKEKTLTSLYLRDGVILASNRGSVREDESISPGGIIRTCAITNKALIYLSANNVRITGIVIQGPDPARHLQLWNRSFSGVNQLTSAYYYTLQMTTGISIRADNIEVDNCEVSGFTSSAISLSNSALTGAASIDTYVHHSYIHDNQIKGLGYGVVHGHSYSTVAYNLFNYNRHSIAASGYADSGYTAYCNVEFGESVSHYFDMHGGADRKDGTIIAGEYVDMYNNTFLGTERPYAFRGVPTDHQSFSFNICYKSISYYGDRLYAYGGKVVTNNTIGKNIWDLASGNILVKTGY